ncbi:hypothetical protein M3685_21985 [Heyndrickxia oleronia]|uniref:hypothetical protein n=1 Tax=Heyndrickxia oleronia TaxID=38875 RepID=UPI00204192CD|nr:hypothetical protein [Heyndrickxia oleronia]MCM3456574.1 hypothetical protein [Heyndrickxia oleronia]
MCWVEVNKSDSRAVALADRHYTRQKPGTKQFCRPGNNIVLLSKDEKALWVTWRGIRDDGLDAWECTLFRNEGEYLSSHLIVLALGITVFKWGKPPKDGVITYVGKHLKGGTFHAAGFRKIGESKKRKLPLLQLSNDRMPPPLEPADNSLFEHEILI